MAGGSQQGIFIGVGSNIDAENNIINAIARLVRQVRLVNISTFYETDPIDAPGTPPFLNGVLAVDTQIPPRALKLNVLRRIEADLGRIRRDDKNAPRTIDLDVLLYHDLIVQNDDLCIPDPDIERRPFLARCIEELNPGVVVSGRPISDITNGLGRDGMRLAEDFTQKVRDLYLSH